MGQFDLFKSRLFNLGVKRIGLANKSKWIGLFFNFLFILKITYI